MREALLRLLTLENGVMFTRAYINVFHTISCHCPLREVGQLNIAMENLRRFEINTLEIERES